MKKILFTVTNDLNYDQRMQRICTTLAGAGYDVVLIGSKFPKSKPVGKKPFHQVRLNPWFFKGKFFYMEFNLRLFFYLLFTKADLICAIDLDTILPCLIVTGIKKIPRVYDAHELFCEMKEVVTRPLIYKCWKSIERFSVPKFKNGYTVSSPIAEEFKTLYGVHYAVIRNVPLLGTLHEPEQNQRYILYQGAVNEGRSFETLIPAMREVKCKLIICGDGNFMQQALDLVQRHCLEEKIIFKGMTDPDHLKKYTENAYVGLTLFEHKGKSNYYSLANRFFDYLNAGVPQLCVDYPAYVQINEEYKVAMLINDLKPETISQKLNNLLSNDVLYRELKTNCMKAREIYNWQEEEKKLIHFYNQLFY